MLYWYALTVSTVVKRRTKGRLSPDKTVEQKEDTMVRRLGSSTGIAITLLAACVFPAAGQMTLGDFVENGGYDWILGRWISEIDGNRIELDYQWILNKHAVLAQLETGEFKFRGMVYISPSTGEIIETAADNRGGIWKGDWTDEGGDLVCRIRQTDASGQVNRFELVHARGDADTMTVAMHRLDNSGSRSSEPPIKTTYKRQRGTVTTPVANTLTERSTDYQKLGDLVAEGGYEWMVGKWLAGDSDGQYALEHSWTLDKHAALVDLKMGNFAYHGMIVYVPSRQEIIQVGVDTVGGVWQGTWEQSYDGATHRIEYSGADGSTRKMEHVYSKVDGDTFQVKEYGGQSFELRRTLTFKRQKAPAATK